MRSVLFLAIYCVGQAASVPTTPSDLDSRSSRVLSKQDEAGSAATTFTSPTFDANPDSEFTIDDLKLAAIMATNAYYPPKLGVGANGIIDAGPDKRVINKEAGFDRSVPWCWSRTAAGYHGSAELADDPYTTDFMNRTDNCYDHEPLLVNWEYQGRVREQTPSIGISGYADADVYFNNATVTDKAGNSYPAGSVCYVAIAGTDDLEDMLNDLRAATTRNLRKPKSPPEYKSNGAEKMERTYKVGKGFLVYYDSMREELATACAGPHKNCTETDGGCDEEVDRFVWVTGHSLGAAAANIMHAYGDAERSITFGTPKTFMKRARLGGVLSDKCDVSRPGPNDLEGASLDMFAVSKDGDCQIGYNNVDFGRDNTCVDVVATVAPTSTHCPKEYYRIYKDTDTTGTSYGFDDYSDKKAEPSFVANGLKVENTLSVHPMPAGYLKYLYGGCFAPVGGTCKAYEPPSGAWPKIGLDDPA